MCPFVRGKMAPRWLDLGLRSRIWSGVSNKKYLLRRCISVLAYVLSPFPSPAIKHCMDSFLSHFDRYTASNPFQLVARAIFIRLRLSGSIKYDMSC